MADVKWIKITTDIFDDEKILLIESLPDSYAIITVWFKLLCLAGKQNNSGVFMMGQIAYTDKMLATIFRMKETTVQLALQTFEQFGMVEIIDGVITIPNWGKHQNLDQMESRKEFMRNYMKEYRKKQKALTSGKPSCKPNSKPNVNQAEEDIDKELERDTDNRGDKSPEKRKRFVPPTPEEVNTYCSERSNGIDPQTFIDYYAANGWMVGKGKMKDWKAAVRTWENRRKEEPPKRSARTEIVPKWMEKPIDSQNELDRAERMLAKTAGNDPELAARAEALKQSLS